MSAIPESNGESESSPALRLIDEETEITPTPADFYRWAVGSIATGRLDRAEDQLRSAISELGPRDPQRVQYLFDRATMREQRGWFFYAYLDLLDIIDFIDQNDIDNGEERIATATDGAFRLGQKLEELSHDWPGQNGIAKPSGHNLGFNQVAD